jgi:hypothetical protein
MWGVGWLQDLCITVTAADENNPGTGRRLAPVFTVSATPWQAVPRDTASARASFRAAAPGTDDRVGEGFRRSQILLASRHSRTVILGLRNPTAHLTAAGPGLRPRRDIPSLPSLRSVQAGVASRGSYHCRIDRPRRDKPNYRAWWNFRRCLCHAQARVSPHGRCHARFAAHTDPTRARPRRGHRRSRWPGSRRRRGGFGTDPGGPRRAGGGPRPGAQGGVAGDAARLQGRLDVNSTEVGPLSKLGQHLETLEEVSEGWGVPIGADRDPTPNEVSADISVC